MAPRPSNALSKRAAEYRRAHQIPRKRATNLPLLEQPASKIHKPIARRIKKKPLPKSWAGDQLQQPRGENRINVPGSNGAAWSVRRILASRRKPSDSSVLEYKVQWDTSWEEASTIKGLAVDEWNEELDNGRTFEFRDQNGQKWVALRDETGGENDHEDMQWDMWVAIHRNMTQEFVKDWLEGMGEMDWEYKNKEQERKVMLEAQRYRLREPNSVLDVLKRAWKDLSDNPELQDEDIIFADIQIRYTDILDSDADPRKDKPSSRPALPVSTIVRTLQNNPFLHFDVKTFTRDYDTFSAFAYYRSIICDLIHTTPFMFKAGTWMHLFALLLLGGEIMIAELAKVGIIVEVDWVTRTREYDIQMYYEQVVDNRAPHDIQETYLCLREFFRELKPDDDEEEGEDGVAQLMEIAMSNLPSGSVESSQQNNQNRSLRLRKDLHLAQEHRIGHSRTEAHLASPPATPSGLPTSSIISVNSSSSSPLGDNSPTRSLSKTPSIQMPTAVLPRTPRPSFSHAQEFPVPNPIATNHQKAIRKEMGQLTERLTQLIEEEKRWK